MVSSSGSHKVPKIPEGALCVLFILCALGIALYPGKVYPSCPIVRDPSYTSHDVRGPDYVNGRPYSEDLLDLDPEELFKRTAIVTGFSQNHFNEVKPLIQSVQTYFPHSPIIAYDLGLEEDAIQEAERWCNVQLRKFNIDAYPPHVANLFGTSFKPIIIDETLKEFDVIFWCDASIRFREDPRVLYTNLKEQHGLYGHINHYNPSIFLRRTHPLMFNELGVDRDEYSKAVGNAPDFASGRLLIVNTPLLRRNIIDPWVACALRKECNEPENSTRKLNKQGPRYTHRYDQSALSILAFKNMKDAWTLKNDRDKLLLSVAQVERWPSEVDVKLCR